MGLKGCRLWVMGQLDSNVQSPTVGFTHASTQNGFDPPKCSLELPDTSA
jgi:hypothetical protein